MSDEPFGRQPQPVTVTVKGEPEDVQYWLRDLMRRAGFKGDMVQAGAFIDSFEAQFKIHPGAFIDSFEAQFKIHPGAVND